MFCPSCQKDGIPFLIIWLRGTFLGITCRGCNAKLKITKSGFGKISSYLLGVPAGILLALGILKIFWDPYLFISVLIISLCADYFLDRKYVKLLKKT